MRERKREGEKGGGGGSWEWEWVLELYGAQTACPGTVYVAVAWTLYVQNTPPHMIVTHVAFFRCNPRSTLGTIHAQ